MLALLEIHHRYYLAVAPLPVCLPGNLSNSWSLSRLLTQAMRLLISCPLSAACP